MILRVTFEPLPESGEGGSKVMRKIIARGGGSEGSATTRQSVHEISKSSKLAKDFKFSSKISDFNLISGFHEGSG